MLLNPTMQMACARIAITLRVELRKPSTVRTQIEFFTPRVSAKIATSLFTTSAREILEKRLTLLHLKIWPLNKVNE